MSTFVEGEHMGMVAKGEESVTAAPTPSLRGSSDTPSQGALATADATSESAQTNGSKSESSQDLAADGYPEEMDIPIRYVNGMGGDMEEARRRWIASVKWREAENVDTILEEPVPSFDIIKKYYPHFYFKQAKNGSMVYYEIPGRISLPKLRENGLDMDALCRHYVYITEFLWKELDQNPEGKLLTCMDMKGTKLSMFAGEVKEFLVRSAKMIGAHYPERSYKIFILNAPWWFTVVWKFVSPFVHPNTKAKVVVCGGGFLPQLEELVDLCNVPEEIGGNDPTPALESPQEIKMREHVMKVLMKNNLEMRPVK